MTDAYRIIRLSVGESKIELIQNGSLRTLGIDLSKKDSLIIDPRTISIGNNKNKRRIERRYYFVKKSIQQSL